MVLPQGLQLVSSILEPRELVSANRAESGAKQMEQTITKSRNTPTSLQTHTVSWAAEPR